MVAKVNQRTFFKQPIVNISGQGITANAAATLTTARDGSGTSHVSVFTLAGQTITVAAAADYGSLLLFTFPASRILLESVDVNLTSTQAGFADNDATAVDFALGSAAASNATLASTMLDIVPKIDGTGTAAGTIAGTATATEVPKFKAASLAVYMNVSDPVTTGTGTLTLTGTIKIKWTDMGSA